MVVLLPFECGAALPDLSAETSPNETSVSGRMLGGALPGARARSMYLNHAMTQSSSCGASLACLDA